MSEMTLNIRDRSRSITARIHAASAERMVAALAADPDTIAELELAIGRFERCAQGHPFFGEFDAGFDDEPWDAGIVSIDLAARIIEFDSTYSCLSDSGSVEYHDGSQATGEWFSFCLASDWIIRRPSKHFRTPVQSDREPSVEPIDERRILYGRLPEFIVRALFRRREALAATDTERLRELIRNIHIDWLMTPSEGLAGRSPRDVLIDDRHQHVNLDVQHQQERWSSFREQPPALARESRAYRFGGFGTTEIVLYYELVRDLLCASADRFRDTAIGEQQLPAEADFLQQQMQEWLHDPASEIAHPRSPAQVIDLERRRLPIKCGPGESIIDPDCPCCQAFANEEEFGPTFFFYDGSEMDDDFAFSFHRTRAEWEAEQQEFEESARRWREQQEAQAGDFNDEEDVPF